MIEKYEPQSEPELVNARLSDCKVVAYEVNAKISSHDNHKIVLPTSLNTLEDLVPEIKRWARAVLSINSGILYGKSSKDLDEGEKLFTLFGMLFGAGSRGKNAIGKRLLTVLEELMRDLRTNPEPALSSWENLNKAVNREVDSSVVWVDWEEDRNYLFDRNKLVGLFDLSNPFEERQIKLVKSENEANLIETLVEGGNPFVIGNKPAGTYGRLFGVKIIGRDFGNDFMYKLEKLEPPFDVLDPNKIFYLFAIGITTTPFVTMVLGRRRAALQMAKKDLKAANEIQEAFMGSHFKNLLELEEEQEGGTMASISTTEEAMLHVAKAFWDNGLLNLENLSEAACSVLAKTFEVMPRDPTPMEVINAAPLEWQDEALEVADFIANPAPDFLISEAIKKRALYETERVILEVTDLRMKRYLQGEEGPFSPLLKITVVNSPNVENYIGHKGSIQNIIKKYRLVKP